MGSWRYIATFRFGIYNNYGVVIMGLNHGRSKRSGRSGFGPTTFLAVCACAIIIAMATLAVNDQDIPKLPDKPYQPENFKFPNVPSGRQRQSCAAFSLRSFASGHPRCRVLSHLRDGIQAQANERQPLRRPGICKYSNITALYYIL